MYEILSNYSPLNFLSAIGYGPQAINTYHQNTALTKIILSSQTLITIKSIFRKKSCQKLPKDLTALNFLDPITGCCGNAGCKPFSEIWE